MGLTRNDNSPGDVTMIWTRNCGGKEDPSYDLYYTATKTISTASLSRCSAKESDTLKLRMQEADAKFVYSSGWFSHKKWFVLANGDIVFYETSWFAKGWIIVYVVLVLGVAIIVALVVCGGADEDSNAKEEDKAKIK